MIVEHKHRAYSKHNSLFACFFLTIACLEVGASATVVRGTKLVPLVGGRRKAGCRLRRRRTQLTAASELQPYSSFLYKL